MANWTQPICERDWIRQRSTEIEGGPQDGALAMIELPYRLTEPRWEQCSWCGQPTIFGAYVRADPNTVPFPQGENKDEEGSTDPGAA